MEKVRDGFLVDEHTSDPLFSRLKKKNIWDGTCFLLNYLRIL